MKCIYIIKFFLSLRVIAGDMDKFSDYAYHPCKRVCDGKEPSMVCEYNFTLEIMYSMENSCMNCPKNINDCYLKGCIIADGNSRLINVINRIMPGPSIEVCLGDEIMVDVYNCLSPEVSSIHWHGIRQKQTPFMDGVPFITQCPINPMATFRYRFLASEVGTSFYHSHSGYQRINGIFGALVIRTPKKLNPHACLYDYDLSEHTITLIDWLKSIPSVYFGTFYRLKHKEPNATSAILINGFGRNDYNCVPPKRFLVKKGFRYRFRIIHNGAAGCPIQMKISCHKMTVISMDGNDISPIIVDTLIISAGERYDIIVDAFSEPKLYWMTFKGLISCNNVTGYAILQYNSYSILSMPDMDPRQSIPDGLTLNCMDPNASRSKCILISDLKSLYTMEKKLKCNPKFQYFMGFNTHMFSNKCGEFTNGASTELINNISMKMPCAPLLQNPKCTFCNLENVELNSEGIAECIHGIEIPEHTLVELIFIDENVKSKLFHPMHLHGYHFRVVSYGRINGSISINYIKELDENGEIERNLNNAPIKDTIAVPNGGYAIIRFIADNPGFWLLHCHIELHMDMGMGLILKIGSKMPKLPKNFPRCWDYYGA